MSMFTPGFMQGMQPRPFDTGVSGIGGMMQPKLDPSQQGLYQMLMGGAGGFDSASRLGQLASGDEQTFQSLEAPALRQFREEIMPSIASRFGGRMHGSAFQGAQASAGERLTEQLQSQRVGIRQKALQDLMGLQMGLLRTPTFESVLMPEKSMFEGWGSGLGGMGSLLASLFGLF